MHRKHISHIFLWASLVPASLLISLHPQAMAAPAASATVNAPVPAGLRPSGKKAQATPSLPAIPAPGATPTVSIPAAPTGNQPATAPLKLTLEASYRQAVDNSFRLSQLRARVEELHSVEDQAWSAAYPSFSIAANVTETTPDITTLQNGRLAYITPYFAHNVGLNVQQAIYTFGRLRWATREAELAKKSGQEDYRREVEFVFDDVASAYHDALLAKSDVGILEERVRAVELQLRDSENLFKRGTVAKFDVLRSQAELSNQQQLLLAARNNARIAADRLLSRVGLPLGQEIDLDVVPLPAAPPKSVDDGTAQALEKRPELGVIEWTLESAKARVGLESSQDKPRLDFFSGALERTPTSVQGSQSWASGVQLSIPIWDGGLTTARIGQAVHIVEQLTQSLEDSRRNVRLEVREDFNNLQNLWDKKDVSETALVQAAEAFRVAQIRYKAGVSTQVELLSAQAAYADAEFAQAQNWHDYQLAWAHWRRAISDEYPAYVPGPLLRTRAEAASQEPLTRPALAPGDSQETRPSAVSPPTLHNTPKDVPDDGKPPQGK